MDEKIDITKPPEKTAGDIIHTTVRTIASAIPCGSELVNAIVTPPIEKRRTEWIEAIAKLITELSDRLDGFDPSNLSENESFISTVLNATTIAIKTHQKEKLEALKNAVQNSALPSAPEDNLRCIYFRLIDSLTPYHIRLLRFFAFANESTTHKKTSLQIWEWVYEAIPELPNNIDLAKKLIEDLRNEFLLEIKSLPVVMTTGGLFGSRVTNLGRGFLNFIKSPFDEEDIKTNENT